MTIPIDRQVMRYRAAWAQYVDSLDRLMQEAKAYADIGDKTKAAEKMAEYESMKKNPPKYEDY